MIRAVHKRARDDARRILAESAALPGLGPMREVLVKPNTLRALLEDSERLARVLDDLADRVRELERRNPPRRSR